MALRAPCEGAIVRQMAQDKTKFGANQNQIRGETNYGRELRAQPKGRPASQHARIKGEQLTENTIQAGFVDRVWISTSRSR